MDLADLDQIRRVEEVGDLHQMLHGQAPRFAVGTGQHGRFVVRERDHRIPSR